MWMTFFIAIISGFIYLRYVRFPDDDSTPKRNDSVDDAEGDDSDRWKTPSEILDEMMRLNWEAVNVSWTNENFRIEIFSNDEYDAHYLNWTKNDVSVCFTKRANTMYQMWGFQDKAAIFMLVNETLKVEIWSMENAVLHYRKDEKNKDINWENDKKDVKQLEKYRSYLSSWCYVNDVWVRRSKIPCKIFDAGIA